MDGEMEGGRREKAAEGQRPRPQASRAPGEVETAKEERVNIRGDQQRRRGMLHKIEFDFVDEEL
jgi:hypothetical protein